MSHYAQIRSCTVIYCKIKFDNRFTGKAKMSNTGSEVVTRIHSVGVDLKNMTSVDAEDSPMLNQNRNIKGNAPVKSCSSNEEIASGRLYENG